jgi:hypothetical protein
MSRPFGACLDIFAHLFTMLLACQLLASIFVHGQLTYRMFRQFPARNKMGWLASTLLIARMFWLLGSLSPLLRFNQSIPSSLRSSDAWSP